MSEPRHAREVSCLALTFFYDYVEEHGLSRRVLQEGLPYSPEYLDNRTNWIDYATFLEIERRMAQLFPQPTLFYDIGMTFGATKGFGFLRPIFRSVFSPAQLYSQLPRLVRRFLFPFVEINFERLAPDHIRGTYTFAEGFPPTDAFFETVRGLLTSVPLMMGSRPAQVTFQRTAERQAVFDVRVAGERGGLIGFFRAFRRRIVATGRMLWTTAGDTVTELEETNRLLQDKVDALTEAKGQLDERVRQLSILNAVAHSASSELDLPRLLEKVTPAISHELGDVATVVLLAEGEPKRLVVASTAHADPRALQALRTASLEEQLREKPFLTFETPAGRRLVVRMMHGGALLGAVAVAVADDGLTLVPFLQSLAGHLGLAIGNAMAYQTIRDLRDNLEVRVRERTSELEEARGQLEDTVDQLRRSDRARNEFFTNVSHELRTPLTLILAPLDELTSSLRDIPEGAREDLRSIRENAQALLRLINEILDFAKLDSERMPLAPVPTNVGRLAEEVVTVLKPLATRKAVSLTYERPRGEVDAAVDQKLIRRVVMNLVSNAVKYIDRGESVRVAVAGEDEDVLIAVSDTGPGISPEHQERIFERFQRVPDATGRVIEGSGIGLAMVKEIVQLHQGHIELQSEPGHGATFRVRLPKRAVTAQTSVSPEASVPDELDAFVQMIESPVRTTPVKREDQPAHEERLLIVEDNDDMRAFLERLFSPRYDVILAADGEEGLAKARLELPRAVVSDVMMPKLDGYELCRELKASPATRHIPVILVSARHGTESALEGFSAGADDFVVKPFSAPELLARVSAQIRIRSLSLALMRMEKQTTLGLMAAGIAHEVLNPVNAVVNAVPPLRREIDRLHDGPDSTVSCEALLSSIERSGRRIQNVVRAILAFSRQDRGEMALRRMKLSEGIDSTLAILRFRIHDGVVIHQDYQWDGAVDCHPDLMNQLLMNLLVNALDAIGAKGGNIWITLDRFDESVRLCVADDGPGVPPALQERIFDPFFTTKPVGSGTGLGLSLAREIVSLHRGTIELGTRSGGGAEFTITLPAESAERFVPAHAEVHA